MFANVVVDIKASDVDIMYSYRIPHELEEFVGIGSRVLVNFGIRKILGYVIEISDECDYQGEVKEIIEVLDYSQELSREQIELAKYIKYQTKCLLVYALEAMYGKNKIAIQKETLKKYPKILKEIKKGNLELTYDIFHYGKNKKEKFYKINPMYEHLFNSLTAKRLDCIRFVQRNPHCTSDDIKEGVGCSIFLIQALVKEEYLLCEEDFLIDSSNNETRNIKKSFSFSFDQRTIIDKYESLSGKPFLFFTNDENFKLDFYLYEACKAVNNGEKVLIVTPTLLDNFKVSRYFKRNLEGYRLLTFANDLNNGDYYSQYIKVLKDEFDIIITTKIGAFLPINNLGMIIVVNENDFNYLNEYTPKYNTIKALEFRSQYHNAKLILSTSCAQVESYYKYVMAKYILLKYLVEEQNKLILVDMNKEYGETSLISKRLNEEISKCLNNKQQVVLMLNSKGYSNYMVCRNCGEVLKCPKCEIPLTYYKEKEETKCKYCGRKIEELSCSHCGCRSFTNLYNGLENLKEKLEILYPNAKVLQMDSDTIKTTSDYHDALLMIENQDVDIIIGTRNVLSIFSNQIRLLGIINLDQFLNSSDYRSNEYTYQMLSECQNHQECVTLVQGYHLDNPLISSVIQNNYDLYYDMEIKNRQQFFYPPFCEINRLIIIGPYKDMYYCANYFKKIFTTIIKENADVLGPIYLQKYKGVQIILKHNYYEKVLQIIEEVENKFKDKKVVIQFERYPRNFS